MIDWLNALIVVSVFSFIYGLMKVIYIKLDIHDWFGDRIFRRVG